MGGAHWRRPGAAAHRPNDRTRPTPNIPSLSLDLQQMQNAAAAWYMAAACTLYLAHLQFQARAATTLVPSGLPKRNVAVQPAVRCTGLLLKQSKLLVSTARGTACIEQPLLR